nr:MAG TPA: hypothetical protein [Caudoviricetes sp.]
MYLFISICNQRYIKRPFTDLGKRFFYASF